MQVEHSFSVAVKKSALHCVDVSIEDRTARLLETALDFHGPAWYETSLNQVLPMQSVNFSVQTDRVLWMRQIKFVIEDGSTCGKTLICQVRNAWLQHGDSLAFSFNATCRIRTVGFYARGDAMSVDIIGVNANCGTPTCH